MGCMLDRCLSKIDIKYNNLDLYKEKEKLLFDKIIIALKDIEQDYNIKISDDEVAYIVKIITTKKCRRPADRAGCRGSQERRPPAQGEERPA